MSAPRDGRRTFPGRLRRGVAELDVAAEGATVAQLAPLRTGRKRYRLRGALGRLAKYGASGLRTLVEAALLALLLLVGHLLLPEDRSRRGPVTGGARRTRRQSATPIAALEDQGVSLIDLRLLGANAEERIA